MDLFGQFSASSWQVFGEFLAGAWHVLGSICVRHNSKADLKGCDVAVATAVTLERERAVATYTQAICVAQPDCVIKATGLQFVSEQLQTVNTKDTETTSSPSSVCVITMQKICIGTLCRPIDRRINLQGVDCLWDP